MREQMRYSTVAAANDKLATVCKTVPLKQRNSEDSTAQIQLPRQVRSPQVPRILEVALVGMAVCRRVQGCVYVEKAWCSLSWFSASALMWSVVSRNLMIDDGD